MEIIMSGNYYYYYYFFFLWLRFKTMCWCYTINCEFSLMFVVIKVKKNRCVDYWKLWNIMRVNWIISWKFLDVKIWCDCTSYTSWLCEEKEILKKWLCEMEMRMKRLRRGQKWKKRKKEKKWNDLKDGELRREWDP